MDISDTSPERPSKETDRQRYQDDIASMTAETQYPTTTRQDHEEDPPDGSVTTPARVHQQSNPEAQDKGTSQRDAERWKKKPELPQPIKQLTIADRAHRQRVWDKYINNVNEPLRTAIRQSPNATLLPLNYLIVSLGPHFTQDDRAFAR